jgi:DNA-binding response OmpR family regulator/Flp pilus assembly protein TadD
MNDGSPLKILIVDDDAGFVNQLEEPLARHGVRVVKAHDLDTALYHFNQNRFDVIVIELEFAPMPGLALVQKWRNHDMQEKRFAGFIIAAGGKRTVEDENLLKELGDLEIINKPFGHIQLLPYLQRSVERKTRTTKFYQVRKRIASLQEQGAAVEEVVAKIKENLSSMGPNGVMMMAEVYETAGRYPEAMQVIDLLLAGAQNNPSLIGHKGRLYLRMGKMKEAKEHLTLADKLSPNNITRLNDMAEMYLETNDPDHSVATMKSLVKLNADEPDIKFQYFEKLSTYGHDDHAMKFCRDSTPPQEVVRFYNNKGVVHSKSGEMDDAIAEYRKALKYYPMHREMHRIMFNLGLAHVNRKTKADLEQAESYLKSCLELEPEFEKGAQLLDRVQTLLDRKKKPKSA